MTASLEEFVEEDLLGRAVEAPDATDARGGDDRRAREVLTDVVQGLVARGDVGYRLVTRVLREQVGHARELLVVRELSLLGVLRRAPGDDAVDAPVSEELSG